MIEQIVDLASQCNFYFNAGQTNQCLENMVRLYKTVQTYGSNMLTALPDKDLQCVGLAFAKMALYFDNGDSDINSVAAENAYYCLAKAHLLTSTNYVMPAIFNLLKGALLTDKLFYARCKDVEEEIGMPIQMAMGGNPRNMPDFMNQVYDIMKNVSYYVLSNFYDEQIQKYKVPTDMFLMLPQKVEIQKLTNELSGVDRNHILDSGKKYFKLLYAECESTLKQFQFL